MTTIITPEPTALARGTRKAFLRILPWLMLGSMLNYLNRVNLGFAALQMNKALALTATAFGIAASLTIIAYVVFEIPSSLFLQRLGSRVWLSRIMITWGVMSALTAVAFNEASLFIIRFLVGALEAGFSPGAILLIALWIPKAQRGMAIVLFLVSQQIAVLFGSPLSGWILGAFNGVGGLAGWQWVFIIEAIPAVALGAAYVWVLRDRPAKAEWLTEAEKTALQGQLDIDNGGNREADHVRIKEILKLTFTNRTIITLAVVVFGANTAGYAIGYFLPAMIAEYGFAPSMVGWIVAIPSLGSIIVAGLWGYLSDHAKRREVVVSVGFMGLIVALVCMVVLQGPVLVVIAVTAANIFLTGAVFAFWPLPTLTIHPDVRPAGIAAVNSFGALGGVVSPIVFGIVHDATGSYDIAILVLAGFALLSGLLVLTVRVHNHLANKEFVNTEI